MNYKNKKRYNKTYRGKKTARIKETEKQFGKFLIMMTVGLYIFAGAYHIATATKTITITNNDAVVKETELVAFVVPLEEGSIHPKLPSNEDLPVEERIRKIAKEQNFKYENYLVNLACCEGLLKTDTINDKGNYPVGSIDRGLYGINNYWHAEVSDEVAFDLRLSTLWTIKRINAGYQKEWMCNKKIRGNKDYFKRCLN